MSISRLRLVRTMSSQSPLLAASSPPVRHAEALHVGFVVDLLVDLQLDLFQLGPMHLIYDERRHPGSSE